MRLFFFLWVLFIIGGSILLHMHVDIHVVAAYLGKLPGDIYITKDKNVISLPLASAFVSSFVLSLFFSLFKRKK
jgi:hypothetical protein